MKDKEDFCILRRKPLKPPKEVPHPPGLRRLPVPGLCHERVDGVAPQIIPRALCLRPILAEHARGRPNVRRDEVAVGV